jgi:AraC-like DNA-binding protein/quercetin dioxygenase-like cupin family protein
MKSNAGHNQSHLKQVDFENARLNAVGVELMTLAQLRMRVPPDQLAQPERVSFHIIYWVSQGTGTHTVDFVEHALQAGSLVCVRPGQVHQWQSNACFDGQLLIFAPAALSNAIAFEDWPASSHPPADVISDCNQAWLQLSQDAEAFRAHTLDIALIRQGLAYLLLRMARWYASQHIFHTAEHGVQSTYRLFIKALETDFRHRRDVQHFTQKLGYSASTLSRACLAAEGCTAKTIIDHRVALEAQRLLAHTTHNIHQISHQLGFSEPTNFVKFFHRLVGTTPTAFRSALCSPKGN